MKHIAVLYKEVIENLNVKDGGSYLDVTLGAGGHSWGILSDKESVSLTCLDVDQNALDNFEKKLGSEGFKSASSDNTSDEKTFEQGSKIIKLIKNNFGTFEMKSESFDGILADLGWSTDQLTSLEGLSYKGEGDLDMRFNADSGVRASDLLNVFNSTQLEKMFGEYADIRGPKLKELVEKIISTRNRKAFAAIRDLNQIIDSLKTVKTFETRKFYSQVYQALRIAVNGEYTNLKQFLINAANALKQDGRLLVITFHSGEEKIVNNFLNDSDCELVKVIRPSVEELKENIKAASSKLFIIEK